LARNGRLNATDDIVRLVPEDVQTVIAASDLTGNDAESGTEALEIVSVSAVSNGSVELLSDGSVLFLSAQDFWGDAYFDYTIRDPYGRESTARVEVNVTPVNDAPVAYNDGVFTGVEDQVLIIPVADLLGNDVDVDGDILSIRADGFDPLTGPDGEFLNPGVFLSGTGGDASLFGANVYFSPHANHFGFAGFVYTVTDGNGETSTAEVELNFIGVNDAPTAVVDRQSARLGQPKLIEVAQLLQNDQDIEEDAFYFSGATSGAGGTIRLLDIAMAEVSDATLAHYVEFTGTDLGMATFEYEVTDVLGASSTGRVEVTVRPVNDPPNARNDSGFLTLEDQVLIIDPSDLLANDDDPNGDVITLIDFERFPLNGRVAWTPEGMIAFTPRSNYNGDAGFTYILTDEEGLTDTAFVSILIMPDNDAPVLNDDVLEGVEDMPVTVIPAEAFANDGDPDGDVLFFESANILGVLRNDFTDRQPFEQQLDLTTAIVVVTAATGATLADGAELPLWLVFDAATATFSGTPPIGVTDPIEVLVDLTDTNLVSKTSLAHQIAVTLDPAALLIGDVAVDVPQSNTVAATLADGSALPGWLVFDAETLTFSGTPDDPTAAAFDVRIVFTAINRADGTESAFEASLTIDPSDEAGLAAGIVYDPDYLILSAGEGTFSAAEWTGRPLPGWLAFDAETLSFSRTDIAPSAEEDITRVWLSFTPDGAEDAAWSIELRIDPFAPFDEMQNQLFVNDPYFAALGLMAIPVSGDESYGAQKAYFTDLPDWLSFDETTQTLSGTPPEKYVGTIPVRIDIGASAESGMPAYSIITNVTIDTELLLGAAGGFSVAVFDELLDLVVPKDFDGSFALEYYARDTKGAVSEEPAIIV
ncbi:MAG: tandem-95 repeat protein, partial [Rhodobiaceae bacterium]|nr:tandem-95 repeat protein [Rhodobiaceae bacterium]